jgi:hypothetical protein
MPASKGKKSLKLVLCLVCSLIFLLSCAEPKGDQKVEADFFATGNFVDGVTTVAFSEKELPEAIQRFKNGDISIAFRLMVTYSVKGDEVQAAIYAQNLSIQEGNPDAVGTQFLSLARQERTASICDAMRNSLDIWKRWKDDRFHNYAAAVTIFDNKCK